MAAMNTQQRSTKQQLAAERIAGFGAEQRRLKEAANARRTAAAAADEQAERHFSARPERAPERTLSSRYLR
jgi:hypothetical protein